jgi:hypothetical protein
MARLDDSDALRDFLKQLDDSDVEVSDWEARFIESNLAHGHFSAQQRENIMQLMTKYGRRIGYL